jgi:hypothetical protein
VLAKAPAAKRSLERFLFAVKAFLYEAGQQELFYLGQLKHRDLEGNCVGSQVGSSSTVAGKSTVCCPEPCFLQLFFSKRSADRCCSSIHSGPQPHSRPVQLASHGLNDHPAEDVCCELGSAQWMPACSTVLLSSFQHAAHCMCITTHASQMLGLKLLSCCACAALAAAAV